MHWCASVNLHVCIQALADGYRGTTKGKWHKDSSRPDLWRFAGPIPNFHSSNGNTLRYSHANPHAADRDSHSHAYSESDQNVDPNLYAANQRSSLDDHGLADHPQWHAHSTIKDSCQTYEYVSHHYSNKYPGCYSTPSAY